MSNIDDLPEIQDPLYDIMGESSKEEAQDAEVTNEDVSAVDIPDPIIPSAVVKPKVDLHKDVFKGAINMAFVGCGQGGGRLVDSLYKFGYRKICAVNTTMQDLKGLKMPSDRKLVVGSEGGGAGKDPEYGENAAKESYEDIVDLLMRSWGSDPEYLWVTAGGGGGSGTGSWPVVLDAIREYADTTNIEKPLNTKLGVILTLPKRSEGSRVQRNALETINLAIEKLNNKEISSLILVDNSKIHELYPGLPVKMFWQVANDTFTGIFHTFNLLAAQDSEYNTLDIQDYKSILKSGMMIFGRTPVKHWKGKEDISKAVRQNLAGSLLADGFDLSTATTAGAIVVADDSILEQIPMENIDYALFSLGRTLGNEGITLHNGIYEGKRPGMQVFTIVSGLEPPEGRLEELKKLSK